MKPWPQTLWNALWMGWLLTFGLFSWVAFVYLAVRLKRRRCFLWAGLYLAPLPIFLFYPFDLATADGQTLNAIAGLAVPVSGLIALIHGVMIRPRSALTPPVVGATHASPLQQGGQSSAA